MPTAVKIAKEVRERVRTKINCTTGSPEDEELLEENDSDKEEELVINNSIAETEDNGIETFSDGVDDFPGGGEAAVSCVVVGTT